MRKPAYLALHRPPSHLVSLTPLDRSCKRCKGKCLHSEKKKLEIAIDRGMLPGDHITLHEEGDETADSSAPGDLDFVLALRPHPAFTLTPDAIAAASPSRGADLHARLSLTLAESLLGFSRLILVHLDGRGLRVSRAPPGRRGWAVLKPGQKVVVRNEGLWARRGGTGERGDLVLEVEVEYPGREWARGMEEGEVEALAGMLGGRREDVKLASGGGGGEDGEDAEEAVVDEVELGVWSARERQEGTRRGGATEEDEYYEYEEGEREYEQPGCAQQ